MIYAVFMADRIGHLAAEMMQMNKTLLLVLLCACALPPSPQAYAATLYVDTTNSAASDSNTGSQALPWKTIQKAASTAAAGDTVIVEAGEYNEFITNQASGTAGNPITFTGVRGSSNEWLTVIDPSTTISNGWVAAPEIASGVFKNTNITFAVCEMTITNNRVAFVYSLGDMSSEISSAYKTNWTTGAQMMTSPSNTMVVTTFNTNVINFWDGIEAMYYSTNGVCYLRLRDGSDPTGLNIRAAPNGNLLGNNAVSFPVVDIHSNSFVTWENFKMRGAIGCVVCNGAYALIQSNYLANGYARVTITGNSNTIANNEITTDYYGYNNLGAWTSGTGAVYTTRGNLYCIAKFIMGANQLASYDYGVSVSGGTNNAIVGNHIFQTLGVGISVSGSDTNPVCGTQIISNNIANHTSVGILFSEGETLTTACYNYLADSDINLRFHHINSATELSRIVYIYRNTSWLPDGVSQHIFLHGSSTVTGRYVPQFYVYQNSFSGGIGCIGDNGCVYPEDGMTNSMFLNNIFNGGMYYYSNGNSQWTNSWMGPFAYNIITPPWPTYPSTNVPSWFGTNNMVLTNLVWVNASNMNFHLPPNSVAFDAAIDVTQPFTINGVTYPALPVTAVQKGGSAWDIGALEDTIPPPLMLRIVGPGN